MVYIHSWCVHRIVVGITLVLLILAYPGGAIPSEQWNRTFGGNAEDIAFDVKETSDGGFAVAGQFKYLSRDVRMPANVDAWIIKTDADGKILWDRTIGSASDEDKANSVQQTSDGGYIIAGVTKAAGFGAGSDTDAWIIKTDLAGNELWKKTYQGDKDAEAKSVQQTGEGGYIIAGIYSYGQDISSAFIIKTDPNGTQQWSRTFGEESEANSVRQTRDGGYIVAGYMRQTPDSGSNTDASLLKIAANGNKQWGKEFGGKKDDVLNSVRQTRDGGYILAGNTRSYDALGSDAWLFKTDPNGNELWRKTFGGTGDDSASSVQQTGDGGFILAGSTDLYNTGKTDAWLIKTDANGSRQWIKTFGGQESDRLFSVEQTAEGDYILAGVTYSFGSGSADAWLIKVSGESGATPAAPTATTPSITLMPTSAPATPSTQASTPAPVPQMTAAPKTPGFEAAFAIAGMFTMAYRIRRII